MVSNLLVVPSRALLNYLENLDGVMFPEIRDKTVLFPFDLSEIGEILELDARIPFVASPGSAALTFASGSSQPGVHQHSFSRSGERRIIRLQQWSAG